MPLAPIDRAFEDLRSRLDRVHDQLGKLQPEIIALEQEDRGLVGEFEPDASDYVFRVAGDSPVRELGLLIGEAVHQMRSALDNLVWALVWHRGGQPSRETAFVISSTESGWQRATTPGKKDPTRGDKLRGLSVDDRTLIQALQPYHRGPVSPIGWVSHPLAQLQFFSNTDKHHILQPTFYAIDWPSGFQTAQEASQLVVPDNDTTGIVDWVNVSTGFAHGDSTEVLRAHVPNPGPNPKMRVAGGFTLRVAIGYLGRPLTVDDLIRMWIEVQVVVRLFEELL